MKEFFLVCPIGLESLVAREIELKYPNLLKSSQIKLVEAHPGGLEVQAETSVGLGLNIILKTPSKILMRVKEQKCRDYPKLFNIIKKINWKEIYHQTNITFICHTSESRIIHTGRAENTCTEALNAYFEANKIKEKQLVKSKDYPDQKVYIRIHQDTLTISLDTSGELMHIRGGRSYRGHASIRENIASLLLLKLLADHKSDTNLIDPMCGTGTFLFEALNFERPSERKFLCHYFKQNEMQFDNALTESIMPKKLFGRDIDSEVIKKNQSLESTIHFQVENILEEHAEKTISGKNIVIINPPYGKRIKITGDKIVFFKKLIKAIQFKYKPICIGMIIPRDFASKIKADQRIPFNQNGIKVEFLIISY